MSAQISSNDSSTREARNAASSNPLPFDVDGIFGVIWMANMLAASLFGILTVQVHRYYSKFSNDSRWLKSCVAIIWWTLDLAHSITVSAWCYINGVRYFDDPQKLFSTSVLAGVNLQLEPLIALLVQLFFARRHWLLSGRKYMFSAIIVMMALITCGFGIATGALVYRFHDNSDQSRITMPVVFWLTGSVVVDVMITVSLAWLLWTKKTGYRQTDRLVTKIIAWTINTGLLTTILAILIIIVFFLARNTRVDVGLTYILAKLYSNTLLASLNRRENPRKTALPYHLQPNGIEHELEFVKDQVGSRRHVLGSPSNGVIMVMHVVTDAGDSNTIKT